MFIGHSSFGWMLAGIVVVIGIVATSMHFITGKTKNLVISILVWIFVFKLHGGKSTEGIMTATFATVLFDLIGLPFIYMMYWLYNRRAK